MRVIGLILFSIALLLTFGLDAFLDYRAWMFVIGSSAYTAGVELSTKIKRCKVCGG